MNTLQKPGIWDRELLGMKEELILAHGHRRGKQVSGSIYRLIVTQPVVGAGLQRRGSHLKTTIYTSLKSCTLKEREIKYVKSLQFFVVFFFLPWIKLHPLDHQS